MDMWSFCRYRTRRVDTAGIHENWFDGDRGRYFLLGNLGQQLDLQDRDRQREIDQLRDHLDSQWSRDADQDARIDRLMVEVRDLKLYLAGLVKLLVSKQVVRQEDIEELVKMIDDRAGKG